MYWMWQWGARSNEQAVANARAATTTLSRLRVEREEVARFLRQRYAVGVTTPAVADVRTAAASR